MLNGKGIIVTDNGLVGKMSLYISAIKFVIERIIRGFMRPQVQLVYCRVDDELC